MPYADIIHYSDGIDGDILLIPIKNFLFESDKVTDECYKVLKKEKLCAILMGDTRKKVWFNRSLLNQCVFLKWRVSKQKKIIKEQHNCKATGYWKTNSIKFNFLLLAHEYLFVFRKGNTK